MYLDVCLSRPAVGWSAIVSFIYVTYTTWYVREKIFYDIYIEQSRSPTCDHNRQLFYGDIDMAPKLI